MNLDTRLLRLALTARAALFAAIFLGFSTSIFIILQARLISHVIGRVHMDGASLARVMPVMTWLLAVMAVRALLVFLAEGAAAAVAIRVKRHLRQALTQRLFDLGPTYLQDQRSGELSAVLNDGVEALDAYFSQYLPQLVLAAAIPAAILVVAFPVDLLTGIVLLITAPLIPMFMTLIGSAGERLTRRQWTALSRMSAFFLDTLQGLTTLKLLGRSRARASEIAAISERYRLATLQVLRVTFLSAFALELAATISIAVVAVQIGLRLLAGTIEFEVGFFLLLLAPEYYQPLRLLGQRFHAGMSGVAAAARIFEILDTQSPAPEINAPGISQIDLTGSILRFEQVSYTYAGRRDPAVQDITFAVEPGQQLALVGPSGAGKSTIALLLLRFIRPDAGAIRIGAMDISGIGLDAWRAQTAWVSQQPYLFNATLAENLRIAKTNASLSELRHAARLALLDDWIQSLPRGYDTPVGEGGARLSGGQAQRLALARAFLKDAPLLVMDEPTAHLDPQQEALLEEVTRRLCAQRRVILIAHRLPTVIRSDIILFIENGQVIEAGAHAQLYQQGGAYYRLVNAYSGAPA